jgi:hypothetical protein
MVPDWSWRTLELRSEIAVVTSVLKPVKAWRSNEISEGGAVTGGTLVGGGVGAAAASRARDGTGGSLTGAGRMSDGSAFETKTG